ncbi:MAG TPA: hypothetical protein VFN52_01140 [Acidiferrobacteraceae bacterium]|nr:hypothetical protein [Acidiferrobacteraceae bacterium]
MHHIPALNELSDRFQRAGAALVEAYAKRRAVSSDEESVTPVELVDAVRQFFEVAERVDGADRARVTEEDIDQIGDHALNLTTDLVTWAQQLQLRPVQLEMEQLPIAIADWVIRHGGHIRTLEPVVNALAEVANTQHDADSLRRLVRFMGQVISATEEAVKQDLEKGNPGRPWRLIHLNRGIVATRSHDLKIMEEVFDDLIRYLPDEAGSFFEEGMRQMEALDYPEPVRAVMARYFAAWTQHRMH